ncbi:multidrug effflux MFS transporter [Agaribacter marinus]|uniref:Bcr/CflA family efflux transporter n=1 Tax=Agaribacter marinus TaxID=1431249 RepID=A0AA37SX74_9ALTE|nr:multidrug effflux MFS transporter [Agaribacter marinus]GLR71382.1 MFS transporter [Agaribacter marinus]
MHSIDSISTETQTRQLPLAEFIVLMALFTALIALSIDAMLPALDIIGNDLNSTSPQQNYLIISLFFVGLALGQLFFGPFADARGRRLTILVGLIIFMCGTAVCYLSTNIEILLFGRIIQAFGLSGPRIASMALVRDLYKGDAMARVMSLIMVIFILMPMVAPLIGQFVMFWLGWRHIFSVFAVVAIISATWFFLRQGETLPRANRVKFSWKNFSSSIKWLLNHPVVMGSTLGMGTIFGAFLGYLSASQRIFTQIYDTGTYFPLIFALLSFSIGAASLFNSIMVMKLGMVKLVKWATIMSVVFSFCLLASVVVYLDKPPLWLFILIMFIGFFFIGILFGNLNSLAMEPVGHIAGVGAAFIGSFSTVISVVIGVFISQYVHDTLLPIGLGFTVFSILTYISVMYAIRHKQ